MEQLDPLARGGTWLTRLAPCYIILQFRERDTAAEGAHDTFFYSIIFPKEVITFYHVFLQLPPKNNNKKNTHTSANDSN